MSERISDQCEEVAYVSASSSELHAWCVEMHIGRHACVVAMYRFGAGEFTEFVSVMEQILPFAPHTYLQVK